MHPVGEVTRSPLAPRDDSRLAFSFHACHRSVMLSQPSRGQRKLMRTDDLKPTKLPDALRETQRLLFIAKHAKWTGGLHPEDGNHALYHRETREILEALGDRKSTRQNSSH